MEADPLGDRRDRRRWPRFAWVWVEDWERASRLLARVLTAARDASAVTALIHPLAVQAHLDLRRGRWASALAGASEAAELAEDAGQLALLPHALAALSLVEAGLGHEHDCREHVARGLELSDDDVDLPRRARRARARARARSPRRSRRSRPASARCSAAGSAPRSSSCAAT